MVVCDKRHPLKLLQLSNGCFFIKELFQQKFDPRTCQRNRKRSSRPVQVAIAMWVICLRESGTDGITAQQRIVDRAASSICLRNQDAGKSVKGSMKARASRPFNEITRVFVQDRSHHGSRKDVFRACTGARRPQPLPVVLGRLSVVGTTIKSL